jgi:hypothetical protein
VGSNAASDASAGKSCKGSPHWYTSISPLPLSRIRPTVRMALASRHAVPAIYAWPDFAAAGGLISYGINNVAVWRQAGSAGNLPIALSRSRSYSTQRNTQSSQTSVCVPLRFLASRYALRSRREFGGLTTCFI